MATKPLFLPTYLSVIKGAPGTKMFRSSFSLVDGKKKDIMKKGNLSCAFFVSGVLAAFGLIDRVHATVSSTVTDMEGSGWVRVKKLRPGSVLVWEAKSWGAKEPHRHIGFYVARDKAVSNIWQKGVPALHHATFGHKNGKPARAIEQIWWNPRLEG